MSLEDKFEREGVEVATLQKRAFAYVIDDILVSLVVIAFLWGRFTEAQNVEQYILLTNSAFIEIITVRFLYQVIFVYLYGATLGKQFMKIKVIDCDSLDKPELKGALLRGAMRTMGEVFFYFTFIFAFFDPLRRTLHDKVANTAVVNAI